MMDFLEPKQHIFHVILFFNVQDAAFPFKVALEIIMQFMYW